MALVMDRVFGRVALVGFCTSCFILRLFPFGISPPPVTPELAFTSVGVGTGAALASPFSATSGVASLGPRKLSLCNVGEVGVVEADKVGGLKIVGGGLGKGGVGGLKAAGSGLGKG